MPTCTVSGIVVDAAGDPVESLPVLFRTQTESPVSLSTTTDTSGAWSLPIEQGSSGVITFKIRSIPASKLIPVEVSVLIPNNTSANFADVLVANQWQTV